MGLVVDILALIIGVLCVTLGIFGIPVGILWIAVTSIVCGGFIIGIGTCDLIEKGWKN